MTKTKLIFASASLFLAGAFTVQAQTDTTNTTTTTTTTTTERAPNDFGARAGDWEFTLGGGGATNKDFDNSFGGANLSLGLYLSDTLEASVRQSGNYSNDTSGEAVYNGSTFAAIDYHFGTGRLRPFVGLNFGALYGESTSDTWAAGIEGGLKYYVQPKTFIFALVNYAWSFEHSSDLAENIGEGAVLWTMGVGFNF